MIRRVLPFVALVVALVTGLPLPVRAQGAASNATRFESEIRAFRQWDDKNAVPEDGVLFVGSSSIRMWRSASAFPGLPVINRGFGGSQISDVNHYIQDVALKYRPAVVVFYAGENDIASGKTPERVRDDFRDFVQQVLNVRADTRIIFIGLKPSVARWDQWPVMQKTNDLIRSYIEDSSERASQLHFADVATAMLSADGQTRPELYVKDGLHMTDAGYAIWERVLGPILSAATTSR